MAINVPARTALVEEIAARVPETPAGGGPSGRQIADVVAAIVERFEPEQVVLYGSRAYGVPKPESDVDLMIVLDAQGRPSDQVEAIRGALREATPPPPPWVTYDVKVVGPERVRLGLAEGDFFLLDVMVLGATLYAKDGTGMAGGQQGEGVGSTGETPGLRRATTEWFAKAESDFQLAERAAGPPRPLWDGVCFNAQQFVEKALKALLQERGVRSPLTHDLVRLANPIAATTPGLDALRDDLAWLTPYAVDVRYPGKTASEDEALRALGIARQVRSLAWAALGLQGPFP